MGGTSSDDLVPMEMKTFVSRRAKEDNEVGRHRAPFARGAPGAEAGGGDGHAVARGGLGPPGAAPNAQLPPKKKKKGGGKGEGRAPTA